MKKYAIILNIFLTMSFLFSYSGNLSCSHCGINGMDKEFLKELKKLEKKMQINFHINSGFRCRVHNRNVGGDDNSQHLDGLSVDISDIGWSRNARKRLIRYAE